MHILEKKQDLKSRSIWGKLQNSVKWNQRISK